MPVYRKSKDKWKVVIYHQGRRHDFTVEGLKTEAESFEARKRLELETRNTEVEFRVAPTFFEFSTGLYAQHARMQLRASTWAVRKYQLATLVEILGDKKLSELNGAVVEGYKQTRFEQGRKATTINNEIAVLQAVLAYAKRIGVPCASPSFLFLRTVKSTRAKASSTTEVNALLDACEEVSPNMVPLVVFLANTGVRRTEAMHLTWENVDFARRMIRIWPSEEWRPKDDEAREIPMSDALHELLTDLPRTSKWVFPTEGGGQYADWPKKQFDRARKAANLTGGPHTLRHTFASHFLSTTPDMFLLARVLGHSDTQVTRLYSHLLPDHLERARNAVSFAVPTKAHAGKVAGKVETLPKTASAPTAEARKQSRAGKLTGKVETLPATSEATAKARAGEPTSKAAASESLGKHAPSESTAAAPKKARAGKLTGKSAGGGSSGKLQTLPDTLPRNVLGDRAAARSPKSFGLDVLGIEPRTSRVRF